MNVFAMFPRREVRRLMFASTIVLTLFAVNGCALFRGGGGGAEETVTVTEYADEVSAEEYEARLRELVQDRLAGAQAQSGSAELVTRRPYHYREYSEIPGSSTDFDLEFVERDSRTSPYTAEVSYPKVRYSTKLHKNRNEARLDDAFVRDTGVETLSFELRNDDWRQIGSFFVADRTEEMVDGEWRPVSERVERTIPAEEPSEQGWMRRTLDRLTFWN